MKVTLYKLLEVQDSCWSDFDNVQVLTETELRSAFIWYLENDYFNKENLKLFTINLQSQGIEDIKNNIDISTIYNIFAENGVYDSDQRFCIEQVEIEL